MLIFLPIYLACGAVAFWWVASREKEAGDDFVFLPIFILGDPMGWIAWLLWPIALPIYQAELVQRARQRRERRDNRRSERIPRQPAAIGSLAKTVTRMNPTGIVSVGGKRFEATAEDGYLNSDEDVVIVEHRGSQMIVRKGLPHLPDSTRSMTRR